MIYNNIIYIYIIEQMCIAADSIPKANTPARTEDISQESLTLIKQRQTAIHHGDGEQIKEITKKLRSQRKQDKKKRIQAELSHRLDVRDWWAVIKKIRKQFTPMTYALKDKHGKIIKKKQRAEASAIHLKQNIWGLDGLAKRAEELKQT